MLRQEIKEYLAELNDKEASFSFHDVASKIREVIQKDDVRSVEDNAEIFAFNVYTNSSGVTSWNSYFGPMMSFANPDGTPNDFPSREIISNEILEYWESRFKEVTHPLLKALYADLLIEFSALMGRRVELEFAKSSIRNHLESVKKGYELEIDAKDALERALILAQKFNDTEILPDLLQEAIELEKKVGEDDKPGLWGFVLEWFVLSPHIQVPAEIKESVIKEMEERYKRLFEAKKSWLLKSATVRLADYYVKTKSYDSLKNVLSGYESVIRDSDEFKEGTLGELHYLQDLEELYVPYALTDEIKSSLAKIRNSLRNFRLDPTGSEFKEISAETTIPTEEIDKFVSNIFQKEEISAVAGRIARDFLIRKERDEKSLRDISSKYVFAQIATGNIFDEENRLIAQIPPISEAFDAHLRRHSLQNLDITSVVFLERVLAEFVKRYTLAEFSSLLRESACFSESNEALVEQILGTYWDGNYFAFAHMCTPFIEAGIRKLLHLSGAAVTKQNREGGYDYCSLNFLLDNEQSRAIFQHIFAQAGDDVIYTLQITLTEGLGQNIRNRVAHGISQADFFKKRYADNLIKILFLLSIIRRKEDPQ